jgi:hypothetical protein
MDNVDEHRMILRCGKTAAYWPPFYCMALTGLLAAFYLSINRLGTPNIMWHHELNNPFNLSSQRPDQNHENGIPLKRIEQVKLLRCIPTTCMLRQKMHVKT